MNAWEELFIAKVISVRREEKRSLRIAGYAQSLAIASGCVVPVVATFVTVLSVVFSGSDLLASDAFSAITVFFVMLFGMRMIPYGNDPSDLHHRRHVLGMRYLAEARSAITRIQELLLFPKYESSIPLPQPTSPTDSNQIAISMSNSSFSWDVAPKPSASTVKADSEADPLTEPKSNPQCLQKLTLSIKKGELIGLCGKIGSGKSAFLNALLGHVSIISKRP